LADTIVGIREYARHRGVSQSAVSQAIDSGRILDAVVIKRGARKLIKEKADQLWDENSLHQEGSVPKGGGGHLIKARAAKETFAAKMAQLKYEQASGKLVRIEDVKRAASSTSRVTRDLLLTIPNRLAPILASETDINKINKLLTQEIRQALESLSQINWDQMQEDGSK